MVSEKLDGCNHMSCASCKAEWCWLCETSMDINDVTMHFLEGQGGPCAGLQFVEADTVEEAKANATLRRNALRRRKRGRKIAAGIALSPLILVGGVVVLVLGAVVLLLRIPYRIIKHLVQDNNNNNNNNNNI
mmetsp:Transcript_8956/g.13576  ORF Transcript_8956/g.13576 Transcript_8956/m.13576 type:complete len:132 (+) Transcript_8956:1075-1470(+)